MKSHYIVIADHAHLRVFSEKNELLQTPGLEQVHALDFAEGHLGYTDNDTDMAGRFQGSKTQGAAPGSPAVRQGMSIDERLPMQREATKRNVEIVTRAIEAFLVANPDASWDFAAGPGAHNAILERLSAPVRARLRRSLAKDLVNQPVEDLRERFTRAA
jgi:hypothetical protein